MLDTVRGAQNMSISLLVSLSLGTSHSRDITYRDRCLSTDYVKNGASEVTQEANIPGLQKQGREVHALFTALGEHRETEEALTAPSPESSQPPDFEKKPICLCSGETAEPKSQVPTSRRVVEELRQRMACNHNYPISMTKCR